MPNDKSEKDQSTPAQVGGEAASVRAEELGPGAGTWVYKEDGTLQCGMGREIPLDEMRKQLAGIIGDKEILRQEKRHLPLFLSQRCGARTGNANAYELTQEGARILFKGFVGPLGFQLWTWPSPSGVHYAIGAGGGETAAPAQAFPLGVFAKDNGEFSKEAVVHALETMSSVDLHPVLVRELIGRLCRIIRFGDVTTMEYIQERVNIRLDDKDRIVKISFG
jgi:hypothetical protein